MAQIDERRRALLMDPAVDGTEIILGVASIRPADASTDQPPFSARLGPIYQAKTPFLEVAHHELGSRDGTFALLHDFPYDSQFRRGEPVQNEMTKIDGQRMTLGA